MARGQQLLAHREARLSPLFFSMVVSVNYVSL
jgi:hypothetical protein